ncbi:MAG: histidinol dehydrogenase, partial [Erythrobacter sp.]
MATWLKKGATIQSRADADRKVRDIVEQALADIEKRGDTAIREMSNTFDKWDRDDYRLSDDEIARCVDSLTAQERKDIEFAQAQVRNFAKIQRESMKDVEVETLPGV